MNWLMETVIGLGESGWSSQQVASGPIDSARYADHRCRLSARGFPGTGLPFLPFSTFCLPEYGSF